MSSVRPKQHQRPPDQVEKRPARWLLPLVGLAALVWYAVRVVPKPSRALYPCQRAAAPVAGGFVLWLAGLLASAGAYRQAHRLWRQSRFVLAGLCLVGAAAIGVVTLTAPSGTPVWADPPVPNAPIGVAQGVKPGRVVWVHDPAATDWAGPGDGHWWESTHTNQTIVDRMMSGSLRGLTDQISDAAAWNRLFRYFNLSRGAGDVGYATGEKIVIKVNFVGCHYLWGGTDTTSYDMVRDADYMNTSPQMILALLRQLVYEAGVAPADISVGDPLCLFPNEYYAPLSAEFPDVHYLDYYGGNAEHPRTGVPLSDVLLYWSSHPTSVIQDYVPACYVEAAYLINLANFKSHSHAGVTLGAKNHYGSLARIPVETGYFDMHLSLANVAPATGQYRALVDLLGHAHLGRKTLLCLIDGLYSGVHPDDTAPRRWDASPFNGDWTSSLFASQDPIALDSVCFDLMQEEGDPRDYPKMSGADDYLLEAARADNPPSGTFYDPDHAGDVERVPSLGVHEHWNNPIDMQYSRNLGTGDGIELVRLREVTGVGDVRPEAKPVVLNAPNPFLSSTWITFTSSAGGTGRLAVFAVDGRLVRRTEEIPIYEGENALTLERGDLPSGVYFYRLTGPGIEATRKMVVLD